MKVLLEKSKNQQMPIEMIYLSEKGFLTQSAKNDYCE